MKTFLILFLLGTTFADPSATSCPSSCNCQVSELRDDLLASSWNPDQDAPKLHPNEAIHLADEDNINFHGLLRTAICVYQSDVKLDAWMAGLPLNLEALTIMQAPGVDKVIFEEHHFQQFPSLVLLDIQAVANASSVVLKSNCLRPLRNLKFLSLKNIRFQGQPDVAPPPPPQYVIPDLGPDLTQWKIQQPVQPMEINFVAHDEPMPYSEYKAAIEHADMTIFSGLERLEVLRIESCGMTEIKWQMFQGLRSLEWLSLDKNELLYIPDFAFYGAPHLKRLSLAHNRILTMHFRNLAGLLELERLDMSDNNLSYLSELSLPPFPKLLEADFRNNPIENIYKSTFEVMNRTETLFLGGDQKLRIEVGGLSGLDSLRTLTISNAKLRVLDLSTLKGARRLRKLKIQGQVEEIAYDAFSAASKLEQLILRHCQTKRISMDAFYGLFGLSILDLSNNQLTSLPNGIFDQLTSLKELQLQNNLFTTLPEDIFLKLSAKMIRLDGNPWHCSCAMREWRPMSINKVKVPVDRTLQSADPKGGVGMTVQTYQYRFEKRAAPKCKTPLQYEGWSVFHALRKELKCTLSEAKIQSINRRRLEAKKILDSKRNQVEAQVVEQRAPVPEAVDKNETVTVPQAIATTEPITKVPFKELSNKISNDLPEDLALPKNEHSNELAPITLGVGTPRQVEHNGKVITLSKKAYKLDLERKRQEKYKRLQQAELSQNTP
ncbi:toll-like receptor 9 [Cloeon dipterum]|uniref:toll-like receptor 9 n=1 Tax=Cloeon dipterum TaxID=197152 RepID=UPI00322011C2